MSATQDSTGRLRSSRCSAIVAAREPGRSGGEQETPALARVLVVRPKLIIADELSLGLAPLVVDVVFEGLDEARRSGITVVLIEQFVHRALALADQCVILSAVAWDGRDLPRPPIRRSSTNTWGSRTAHEATGTGASRRSHVRTGQWRERRGRVARRVPIEPGRSGCRPTSHRRWSRRTGPTPKAKPDPVSTCCERGTPASPMPVGQLWRGPPVMEVADATLAEQLGYHEEMVRAGAPGPVNTIGVSNIAPAIMQVGTDEQKERFLRPMLRGDELWCQGMSEPDAGSDLASLRTAARTEEDTFVVSGQKTWNSLGRYVHWCQLYVRTDPAAPKHKGISCLLVDMASPGITVRPLRTMSGEFIFADLFFDDVVVPLEPPGPAQRGLAGRHDHAQPRACRRGPPPPRAERALREPAPGGAPDRPHPRCGAP